MINFTISIFIFISTICATIISVPDDYPSIQEGINAASDGDEVQVSPGTYTENLTIESDIKLTSTGGAGSTYIIGTAGAAGVMGSVITARPQSGSAVIPQNIEIDGFEIRGGLGNLMNRDNDDGTQSQKRIGGGIMAFNVPIKIKNNNIIENGNTSCGGSSRCITTASGGGISVVSSSEDWSFNDRWEAHPDLEPVEIDLDLSTNTFYGNNAQRGNSISIDGFENNNIDLTNSEFDCYSSEYQDVSDYWIQAFTNMSFEGSQGVEPLYSDVWVDPVNGSDEGNTSGNIENPFKTIDFALGMVYATETNPITIHLSSGNFSPVSGEAFPIILLSNITLKGENQLTTVIDAEQTNRVMIIDDVLNNTISHMNIKGGHIETKGGGLKIIDSSPILENIILSNNYSGYTGGAIYCFNSNAILNNIEVVNNSAGEFPFIVYLDFSNTEINNMKISNNQGSAISMSFGGRPILNNIEISDNHSTSTFGGGINIWGMGLNPIIQNALIVNNSAYTGGGIYCYYSNPSLINVTLANNSAISSGEDIEWVGSVGSSNIKIVNSIILDSEVDEFPTGSIRYSNVNNNFDFEQTNFYEDPLLNEDYTLQEGSPCIDAGTADVDGDEEPDITDYYGFAPDVGAFEFNPNSTLLNGDVNGDNAIDILDIVALVAIILGEDSNHSGDGDLNDDEVLDVLDIVELVNLILNS